jgi:hypothetical protein
MSRCLTHDPRPDDRAAHTEPLPPKPTARLIPVRDFAPQSAPLKAATKPEPVADAESCGAKSSVLLERSSFKAISYYYSRIAYQSSTVHTPCANPVMCRARAHVAHATLFACLAAVLPTRDS